jgi:hypothetical protein
MEKTPQESATPDDANEDEEEQPHSSICFQRKTLSGRDLGVGWIEQRDSAFQKLREHNFPEDLIQAARGLRYRDRVLWDKGARSVHKALRDFPEGPVVRASRPPDLDILFEALAAARGGIFGRYPPPSRSERVDGLLSELLLWHLYELEVASRATPQRDRIVSPVRKDELLPRRIIADITMDMLDDCCIKGRAPGPQFARLLRAVAPPS